MDTPEKYDIAGMWTSNVHLWVVPATVQGGWQGSLPVGGNLRLDLNQAFQRLDGNLTRNGRTVALKEAQIDGTRVRFSVPGSGNGNDTFEMTVNGDRMAGEIRGANGTIKWSASRAP